MFRILLAEFKHETNTLSQQKTDFESFRNRGYLTGQAIIDNRLHTGTEMGAFLDILLDQPDVSLIPVVAANAMPAGPVTQDVFDLVCGQIVAAVRQSGPIDCVLLSLHGAMVTESSGDGEGDLLTAIRQAAGEHVLVVSTLDLHANISPAMAANANALITYEAYPHVDMYDRGLEAARIVLRTLRGEINPVMRCVHLPLILPAMTTLDANMKKLVDQIYQYKQMDHILSVSFGHGFLCADTDVLGATVGVVADGDEDLAETVAEKLADLIWQAKEKLVHETISAQQAIERAQLTDKGPIVFADVADNPGGGSSCDGTHILRLMIEQNVSDAAVALIYDPDAVEAAVKAGVGQMVDLNLGGHTQSDIMGEPINCRAYVRLIRDGRYQNRGPMERGMTVNLKKSAVVEIGGISVIIAANRTQPYDLEIFYAHGIDPTRRKILLLKSTHHYKAAYGPIARQMLSVEVSGLMPQNPKHLSYTKCRRPIYPLDPLENRR